MSEIRPISEDDLLAYVDERLEGLRRAEVERWLAAHPQVAARIAADIAQRDALRAALQPIVEEPLPSQHSLARIVEGRRGRRGPFWQIAAAIALMLVGGAGGWSLRGAQEPPRAGIAALAQEAADSYAVYAPDSAHPVEIKATDAAQFVQWASRRLARPMAIPDLSGAGYAFIGGRVVPTPHGPAVLYMFDNGMGTRLTLLSRNMRIDKNAPMAVRTAGAITSVSWADNGLGFSLVGPVDQAVLHPIADSAKAQLPTI